MNAYVLIVIFAMGSNHPAAIAMQEFASKETCESAAKEILSRVPYNRQVFCMPKGRP